MKNRDRIIRYYQGTDNGELAARLIDLADSTAKGRPYAVSEFVSPGAVQIGETIQAHVPSLVLRTFGGYEGAERVKLAFVSADYDGPLITIRASRPAVCPGMTATGSWGTATSWVRS